MPQWLSVQADGTTLDSLASVERIPWMALKSVIEGSVSALPIGFDVPLGTDEFLIETTHIYKSFLLMGCKLGHAEEMTSLLFSSLQHCLKASPGECCLFAMPRKVFTVLLRHVLDSGGYLQDYRLLDFWQAMLVASRKKSLVIMLGGTSGCGKSTLGSLLTTRFGLSEFMSTDTIRHLLRSRYSLEENPCIHKSTYEGNASEYTAQCEDVQKLIENVIADVYARNASIVLEGVHITPSFMLAMMKRYPGSIFPFIIYISNVEKHRDRFAVRAKYMTTDDSSNKYIKHFESIRYIQQFLVDEAERHHFPMVDNTNVDRSLATMHAVIVSLRSLTENITPTLMTHWFDYYHGKYWGSKNMLKRLEETAGPRESRACSFEESSEETELLLQHGKNIVARARTASAPASVESLTRPTNAS